MESVDECTSVLRGVTSSEVEKLTPRATVAEFSTALELTITALELTICAPLASENRKEITVSKKPFFISPIFFGTQLQSALQ